MTRTFIDSGVLIAAVRGSQVLSESAVAVLADDTRVLLTSGLIRLEVLPKALFHRQSAEAAFYEQFFAEAHQWASIDHSLIDAAFNLATSWNLNAMDALHVAAAVQLGAAELVTTERRTSPLFRVQIGSLKITTVQ